MRRALVAAALALAGCRAAPDAHLVVVETSGPGAARRADLRPDDLVFAWERGGESGALASPFALAEVEIEQSPRGPVTLRGRRGWRDRSWVVPAGAWGLTVRPPLARADRRTYEDARAALAKGDPATAARGFGSLAERLEGDAAAWASVQAGRASLAAREVAEAARAFGGARASLEGQARWQAVAADQAGDALRTANALREAAAAYQVAMDLRTAASARSLAVALSHQQLSRVARRRNDLDAAQSHLEAARALREELAPDSAELALAWFDLGAVSFVRGRLDAASDAYVRALAIQERRVPDSLDVANTLSAQGSVASQRGDFGQADALHRRALALTERLAPDGIEHAYVLNRLGVVMRELGDLDESDALHRRALAVFEKAAPESVEVAGSLNNLGLVAQNRRDWAAAEEFHRRALAIREKLNPRGSEVAASLNNLGAVARDREDLAAAEAYLQRAYEMKRELSPGTLTLGASLHNLGEVLLGQGKLEAARARFREALAIRSRLAPDSADEATDWHSLGLVDKEQGRHADALSKWNRALDLMDAQRSRLGAGDRSGFSERYAILYQDPIALLLEQKRDAEAFAVRERLQARALLALVGPRGAAADEPRPLDLAQARAALDPGVALLAYAALRRATAVFVVRGPGLPGPAVRAFLVPQDDAELRDRVTAFRGLIERGRETGAIEPALVAQGERLYADLVRPAEAWLEGAERVLVSPDGALHLLPFAALVRKREPLTFLAEWKPLPTAASASVYAALKRTRRAQAEPAPRLAAFGDPTPGARPQGRASRAAALGPLPHSREEVERIGRLFGSGARLFVGPEATEAHALAIGKDVRYVHFATHGLLDARSPLDSALMLAPPAAGADGDGLLRAWEVRDRLRLDADLVTLSACESGLGREARAEGLVGLARSFQHAGARSVLASLWAISDRSSARFMESFYSRLRAGSARDRALQEAQLESLRQGAHPYHWAAFQLSGDWR